MQCIATATRNQNVKHISKIEEESTVSRTERATPKHQRYTNNAGCDESVHLQTNLDKVCNKVNPEVKQGDIEPKHTRRKFKADKSDAKGKYHTPFRSFIDITIISV